MPYKKKTLILGGLSIIVFIVSALAFELNYYALDDMFQFFGFFSVILFIVSIILYFLPEQIFITWFKFARIYIPIALVLAVGGGATSNGSDLFNTDAEFFTMFFSVIFVITSMVLIIRAHRRLKRQAKTPPSIVGG